MKAFYSNVYDPAKDHLSIEFHARYGGVFYLFSNGIGGRKLVVAFTPEEETAAKWAKEYDIPMPETREQNPDGTYKQDAQGQLIPKFADCECCHGPVVFHA